MTKKVNDSLNVVLGLVQMSMTADPEQNLEKAISGIRNAAARGAQIVCLPELFRSPYFCTQEVCEREYAEPLPGEVAPCLAALAKELEITLVAGSVYEQAADSKYNTALVFGPSGTLLGSYRKTHIPHDPAFYEQNYFTSGGQNYQVFTTEVDGQPVKLAVLICYDQWFPEAARSVALLGADIVFYPTAIATLDGVVESEGSWQNAWTTVQKGHAVANALVVAAVNRVGKEGSSNFWGGSFVSDAFGRTLAKGSNREEIITVEVDLAHNQEVREGWRFFKERRPDTYGLLTDTKLGKDA
ncbi:MAG: hypothetical protein KDD62_07655 [Bdellovibrionales bacterium]|nr:hypothetical protein [Bdellovibrionales bacterium]